MMARDGHEYLAKSTIYKDDTEPDVRDDRSYKDDTWKLCLEES